MRRRGRIGRRQTAEAWNRTGELENAFVVNVVEHGGGNIGGAGLSCHVRAITRYEFSLSIGKAGGLMLRKPLRRRYIFGEFGRSAVEGVVRWTSR
jgi:hypothetical protein